MHGGRQLHEEECRRKPREGRECEDRWNTARRYLRCETGGGSAGAVTRYLDAAATTPHLHRTLRLPPSPSTYLPTRSSMFELSNGGLFATRSGRRSGCLDLSAFAVATVACKSSDLDCS